MNTATGGTGAVVGRQEFTPFGDPRPAIGDLTQPSLDDTGQKRDGTGLPRGASKRTPAIG